MGSLTMVYEETISVYRENIDKINRYLANGGQLRTDKIGYHKTFCDETDVYVRCLPTLGENSQIRLLAYQNGVLKAGASREKDFRKGYKFRIGRNKYILHVDIKE